MKKNMFTDFFKRGEELHQQIGSRLKASLDQIPTFRVLEFLNSRIYAIQDYSEKLTKLTAKQCNSIFFKQVGNTRNQKLDTLPVCTEATPLLNVVEK